MSEVLSTHVLKGFWVNYDHGRIIGATITIDEEWTNVVVAFLAIVVTIGCGSLWNLLLFATHQFRATTEARDVLWRQQQVIYRSLAPPGDILTKLVKLWHVWKGKSKASSSSNTIRCLCPAVVAQIFALASLAAGVFSEYILDTGSLQVLLQGRSCRDLDTGILKHGTSSNFKQGISGNLNQENMLHTHMAHDFLMDSGFYAALYTNQCYSYNNGTLPSSCHSVVRPQLTLNRKSVPCHFNPSLCAFPKNNTIAQEFDSGYLDSNDDFGINAPLLDRVKLRRVATCAPLRTEGHLETEISLNRTGLNGTQWLLPGLYSALSYGKKCTRLPVGVSDDTTWLASPSLTRNERGYGVDLAYAYGSPSLYNASSFEPHSGLRTIDGDITLIGVWLGIGQWFSSFDDPIYPTHTPHLRQLQNGSTITAYGPDQNASTIGCSIQFQYCVVTGPGKSICTDPMATTFENFETLLPMANRMQLATLKLIGTATTFFLQRFSLSNTYEHANTQNEEGLGSNLRDDQWVTDLTEAENFIRAQYQTFITAHPFGFGSGLESITTQVPPSEHRLCHAQKVVKQAEFANIRVFALVVTLSTAGILVLLDFVVLRGLFWLPGFSQHFSKSHYWMEDSILQVQRIAYQSLGQGSWDRLEKEIPWTTDGERLHNLQTYILDTDPETATRDVSGSAKSVVPFFVPS